MEDRRSGRKEEEEEEEVVKAEERRRRRRWWRWWWRWWRWRRRGGLWPVTCRHSVSSCCSGFSMSQQRTVWSKEPEARSRPLGEKRTVYTAPVCPRRSYL